MLTRMLLLISLAVSLGAEDAMAEYQKAMGSEDWTAKKKAIQAVASLPKDRDDEVLKLLISALSDRQAGSAAVSALRSRTGLSPSPTKGAGGYPGYPPDDSAGSWIAWSSARTADLEAKAKSEAALKLAKKNQKTLEGPPPVEVPMNPDAPLVETTEKVAPPPPSDLGDIDRVIFKTGGSLLCYVVSRRLDADGTLVSVRIAHPEGGGEEILKAELIARIDDNVR